MTSKYIRSGHRRVWTSRGRNKRRFLRALFFACLILVLFWAFFAWQGGGEKAPEIAVRDGAPSVVGDSSLLEDKFLPTMDAVEAPEALDVPAKTPEIAAIRQTEEYIIEKNDTLTGTLLKLGVPKAEESSLVKALATVFSPRKLRPGHVMKLTFDDRGGVESLTYNASRVEIFEVNRRADEFVAHKIDVPIDMKRERIEVSLDYSLYQSLIDAGESPTLIGQLVDILAWDIDFMADPRKGDKIRMMVEKKFVEGEFYAYGKVQAVDYDGSLIKQKAFYFEPTDGYYDEKGKSLARNFLKSPVKFSRISSKFGSRRHPVTHKLHNHLGTDFAAPTGTPVWAMADGRVTKRSYTKYNGNYITIKHNNGYSTYYLHLSRFAKGIKVGQRVKQKQLIGYVGTTGRSTGPHLHLSVKYNGSFINPLKLKRVKRTSLSGQKLVEFKAGLSERVAELGGEIVTPAN